MIGLTDSFVEFKDSCIDSKTDQRQLCYRNYRLIELNDSQLDIKDSILEFKDSFIIGHKDSIELKGSLID